MTSPYFYRTYGINLTSDTAIPGLREETSAAPRSELVISLGLEPNWVQEALCLSSRVHHPRPGSVETDDPAFTLTSFGNDEFFQLTYSEGTRFVVDGVAERLWGTCRPPLTIADIATYLLGPVMGFVLRRRGVMALHASSACIGGQAVVFCGASEAGKSTTAAALALGGLPVLTEDISPVKDENGTLYVEPGYPRICLWSAAVASLFGSPQALPTLTPTWEKCFLELDGERAKFERLKRPLGVIYLFSSRVDEAEAPRIEDMSMRDALLELVQNTYMNWLLDRTQRAAELDMLSRIVTQVPVQRIVPHVDAERIGALCELIVADTARLFASYGSAAVVPDL